MDLSRQYFKINLNKFGDLKRQIELENKTFAMTAGVFVIFTFIIFGFILYYNSGLQKKIENREKLLKNVKEEIKQYQESGDYLSTKDLERMASVSGERIFWAKKLVALSERIDDRVAITHFTFKRGILSLYGITKIDKDEKEFDLIDDFILTLKSNQQISADFRDIRFVKSNKDKEKDVDIIRFQIDCIGDDAEEVKVNKKKEKSEDGGM